MRTASGRRLAASSRWRARIVSVALLAAAQNAPAQSPRGDFALRDGDTVVFLGDSNTEWGTYTNEIENYAVLRYPERRIRFVNAGIDGDMASKAFFRLERDVFGAGATVVFVLLGVNDIGWGNNTDPATRQAYLDYTLKIVQACLDRRVRVYVLSYPLTATAVGEKASDPYHRFLGELTATDRSLLQLLSDEAMNRTRALGAATIDIQREMRRIAATAPRGTRFHQDDGVHLNEFGNQVLAFAILRGLSASETVSSVRIDARSMLVVASDGAMISDMKRNGEVLEFTRLDRALPQTFWKPVQASRASMEKIFEPVNGYLLRFNNLPAGARFTIHVDGINLSPSCGFSSEELGTTLNLATLSSSYYEPKGPWAEQAIALGRITDSKADLEAALSYQRKAGRQTGNWELMRSQVVAALASASDAQKKIGKPRPYRFRLVPLTARATARCVTSK